MVAVTFFWSAFFTDRVLELDYGEVVALFSRSKALDPEEIRELEKLLADETEERHDIP